MADENAGWPVCAVSGGPLAEDFIRFEDGDETAVAQAQRDVGARLDKTPAAQFIQIGAGNDRLSVDRVADGEQFALQLEHERQVIVVLDADTCAFVLHDVNGIAARRRAERERLLPIDHAEIFFK